MPKEVQLPDIPAPRTGSVTIADYNPQWLKLFEREAARIRGVLGAAVLRIEQVGSTSVPGLVPEIDCMLMFRNWLRNNSADRDLYAATKRALAQKQCKCVQDYAAAKTLVIDEIMARASRAAHRPVTGF
jgi:GrpB-like predicted nucleotidyltransferase (UPF0157 family)